MTSRVRKLYVSSIPSGNAYKVQLLLHQLRVEYETIELDILADPPMTRRAEYLAVNPNGRIPAVELSDGSHLAESNAILFYLADDTIYLPDDRLARARILQWMFFEQYSHEPHVAVLRFWTKFGGLTNCRPEQLEQWRTRGQAALDVMERHLAKQHFFAGDRYSIADVALFAYTHSAPEQDFVLGPQTGQWLDRVRNQPRYVPQGRVAPLTS